MKGTTYLWRLFTGCLGGIIFLSNMVIANQTTDVQQVIEGNTSFAFALYNHLRAQDGNLFLSPYSISTALAMTYAGAKGTTETQMANTLRFALGQETLHPTFAEYAKQLQNVQRAGNVTLTLANALWLQQDFSLRDAFINILHQYYATNAFLVNFKDAAEDARQKMNHWVEQQTQKKITELIPQGALDEQTRLVLTNAIYFKGNWAMPFDKTLTENADFWIRPGEKILTPMMHQRQMFAYAENETLQMLEMPYNGDELSLLIFLPKAQDGLAEIETALSSEQINIWLSDLSVREVEVYLPTFKFAATFNLSQTLAAMGMPDAFSEQADFSGMEAAKQLSISEVIHKAFVEVNEEGTEAAAATGVVVGVTSIQEPSPTPIFNADHPFFFLIRDNALRSVLFMGRVVDPSK